MLFRRRIDIGWGDEVNEGYTDRDRWVEPHVGRPQIANMMMMVFRAFVSVVTLDFFLLRYGFVCVFWRVWPVCWRGVHGFFCYVRRLVFVYACHHQITRN